MSTKTIQAGNIIYAKSNKSGEEVSYLVVKESLQENYFRLVSLETYQIMSRFKASNAAGVFRYIERVLDCQILSTSEKTTVGHR